MTIRTAPGWLKTALLLALAAVPVAAGLARLHELAAPGPITPANARFFAAPVPILLHLTASLTFAVGGAFQVSAGIRARWPTWHLRAGRVLAVCGLIAALSGLWLSLSPGLPPSDNDTLKYIRLAVASAMALSIVLAVVAIRRRNVTAHAAWMTRAYALGLGAGTQVLTHLPWFIFVGGMPDPATRAVLMGAGWAINLIVAEIVNARRRADQTRPITIG